MALRWRGYNRQQGQGHSGSRVRKDTLRTGHHHLLQLPDFPGRILAEYGVTSATFKEGSPGSAGPHSHVTTPGIIVLYPPGMTGKTTHRWCWPPG